MSLIDSSDADIWMIECQITSWAERFGLCIGAITKIRLGALEGLASLWFFI
jgi:hypothetical protein